MSSGDNEPNLDQIDLNTLRFQANVSVVKQALDIIELFKRRGGFQTDVALVVALRPAQEAQLEGRHMRDIVKGNSGLNRAMRWCAAAMERDTAQGVTTVTDRTLWLRIQEVTHLVLGIAGSIHNLRRNKNEYEQRAQENPKR